MGTRAPVFLKALSESSDAVAHQQGWVPMMVEPVPEVEMSQP